MDQNSDKRRAGRIHNQKLVRFEGDNFSIYSKLHDISPYGAFLATHYLLEPGTRIKLSMIEEGGSETDREARVIHSSCSKMVEGQPILGLGLEFIADAPTGVLSGAL